MSSQFLNERKVENEIEWKSNDDDDLIAHFVYCNKNMTNETHVSRIDFVLKTCKQEKLLPN